MLRTDALHREINPWAHDLVPAVGGFDEPARIGHAPCAAEGVREGGVGCKVLFDGCALERGR